MTIARSKDRKLPTVKAPPPRPGRDSKPQSVAVKPTPTKAKAETPKPTPPPPPPIEATEPKAQATRELPEVPLTRADVPKHLTILTGELRHGIDAWRGAPYVYLNALCYGRVMQFGWRHTWGLDGNAVTYQHPFGNKNYPPVWVALDLSTDEKREHNRRVLELSKILRAAYRATKPPKETS
jgi:hypothetical protein